MRHTIPPVKFDAWYDAEMSVDSIRDQVTAEVRQQALDLAYLVEDPICFPPMREMLRVNGRFVTNDGRGNRVPEWDWFWSLSAAERTRLRSWFNDTGLAPDQYAALRGVDVDTAMAQWVLATKLDDAARLLERGRVPRWSFNASTTYDLQMVMSDDAVTYLAREWSDAGS